MNRILLATLWTCLSMALLCIGASVFGQRNPKLEIVPGLTMCGDLACYMGVRLNTTTWEEAKLIFGNTPDLSVSSDFRGVWVTYGPVRNAVTYSNDHSIFEIDLIFREGELPFYKVIADLGMPCGVQPFNNLDVLAISFRDRVVFVKSDNFKIRPTSHVDEMDIGPTTAPSLLTAERQKLLCRRSGNGSVSPKYTWQGYRQYP